MVLKSRPVLLGEGALGGWDEALLPLKLFHVSCPSEAAALPSAPHVSPADFQPDTEGGENGAAKRGDIPGH